MNEEWTTPTIYGGSQPIAPAAEEPPAPPVAARAPEPVAAPAPEPVAAESAPDPTPDPVAPATAEPEFEAEDAAGSLFDDWLHDPVPLPGDFTALAYATASQQVVPGAAWSPTIYHGPRRHRPNQPFAPERPGPAAPPQPSATAGLPTPTAEPAAPGTAAEPAATAGPSLLSSSRTMAIASLASRGTGFLRTVAIAAVLGSGTNRIADAYNLGNTLPNMVYELLLGGVLTSVVIPILIKSQHDDADQGEAYTQRLFSIATAGLAVATIIAVLCAPLLIDLYPGDRPFHSLATLWATLLLPEIFFYGLGAMFAAVLNTRNVYGWPAWAPVLNNVVTLGASLAFVLLPGPTSLTTSSISDAQVVVIGLGTTFGIVVQALILIVPLRRSGFRWKWRFRALPHEAGRMAEFRTLTLWVLGYVAISQIGVYTVGRVATGRPAGLTTFTNADLLFQVPYGIVGVSLLTALMPRMSRAAARGDTEAVLDDLRLGARLSAVGLLPISVGLIVLGPAFTSVILVGHYGLDTARLVGIALAWGAFGLLPFALVMLQQRVFYAMRDARTPTYINLAMVATKVVLLLLAASLLHGRAVIIALTVSTSASYVAGALVGHLLLVRRFGRLRFGEVGRTISLISIASIAGGLIALAVVLLVDSGLGNGRAAGLIEIVVGGLLGLTAMALIALRLPLPEVQSIIASIRGRRSGLPE